MVKVSVIVPVYNVEQYLEKCLMSLVNQTLEEIEIIVVNDGATDRSGEIIERFAHDYKKIRSFTKENGGLSDARNYGMKFAQGEYLGFVDSDDYVELDMFEKLYQKAIEDDSDMVECNLYHDFDNKYSPEFGKAIYDKCEMIRVGRSVVWNKIYRRSLIEKLKLRFPKGLIYEDVNFYCKLVPYVKNVSYIEDVSIHYVQRTTSINNFSTIRTMDILKILRDVIHYYKKNGLYEEYKTSLEYLTARIILCSSFKRMVRIQDPADRKKALRANYKTLQHYFPGWRKNPFLWKEKSAKSIYMRIMNPVFYSMLAWLEAFRFQKAAAKNR